MASKLAGVTISTQLFSPVDFPTRPLAASLSVEDQAVELNGDAMTPRDSGFEIPSKEHDGTTTQASTEQSQTLDQGRASTADLELEVEKEATNKEWVTDKPIDLYCKKNGQPHAILTSFGYWTCPECRQDLRQPDFKKPIAKEMQSGKGTSEDFSYSVRYLDEGEYTIMTEPWIGPFDLTEARKGVVLKNQTVFTVVTELITSIPGDKTRRSWEVDEIMKQGILSNPSINAKIGRTGLTVNSQALIRILRKIVLYHPAINLEAQSVELWSPYDVLWLYFDRFEEYLSDPHTDDSKNPGKKQLRQLLDFVKDRHTKEVADERLRHKEGRCTYDMLWLLYEPGSTVYAESDGRLSAYVVSEVRHDPRKIIEDDEKILKGYEVAMWSLDFDGNFVGRLAREKFIPPFSGERKITDLSIIPCHYKDEEDGYKTRNALIRDGKKWYKLLRGEQVYYTGHLLDNRNREFQGRVYVDSASFYNIESAGIPSMDDSFNTTATSNNINADNAIMSKGITGKNPWAATLERPPVLCDIGDMGQGLTNCPCEECFGFRPHPPPGFPWTLYDLLNPDKDDSLELPDAADPEHRYLLCAKRLFGFDLRSRNWLVLDARFCGEANTNTTAINKLVMPEERKNMIKALIQKYSGQKAVKERGGAWKADFIDNKGEGQIFLLHGSPGVGKTYTAGKHPIPIQYMQCIAEYTGRALLSLTCADIGTDEIQMEKRLLKWFQLAEKWGAVMLIDEADVFLERRSTNDLKRNSLVSVFLRCVEYYRGVLFLTTNRVGHFDDAFMSRIHVIIHYKTLSVEDRRKIWAQFFDKLEEERDEFEITERARSYVFGKDSQGSDSDDGSDRDRKNKDIAMVNMPFNGREIRNAFQTAVALAEFRHTESLAKDQKKNDGRKSRKGPKLDRKDFEQVCKMMQEFKRYLDDVHDMDEERRAHAARARALPEGYYEPLESKTN